jgi:NADPH2:quinone reductase
VTAVGLNFFDTLLLQYQVSPPLPFSPGAEIAGGIEGVGANVPDFKLGQRVVAYVSGNGCREKVVTKAKNAVPIPDGVSDEVAAGITITYGTALHGLKDRAGLQAGETVAILGAAGGAGLAAVEIAKLMGARVIAVASSGDKLAFARTDEGINYETEDLKTRLKQLTKPKGIDVLYDPVGGAYAEPSLRAMAWEGRYLVLGFASGTIPRIPLNLVMLKGCAIIGVFWTAFVERYPGKHRANMIQLLDWCQKGLISPHIHASFALVETGTALSLIEGRKVTGKVIVNPQR